jgi:hypothetical protein
MSVSESWDGLGPASSGRTGDVLGLASVLARFTSLARATSSRISGRPEQGKNMGYCVNLIKVFYFLTGKKILSLGWFTVKSKCRDLQPI